MPSLGAATGPRRTRKTMKEEIFAADIWPFSRRMGVREDRSNVAADTPIMAGDFHFQAFHSGLFMHTNNAVERQNSYSRLELPAGISFNIVFAGVVRFSFADQRFVLAAEDGLPTCSAIINPGDEVLTRHMTAGMHVRKVNVFVEKRWLLNRCHSMQDHHLITDLLRVSQVLRWHPGPQVIRMAEQLLRAELEEGFSGLLIEENMTLQLLAPCMDELYQQVESPDVLECQRALVRSSLKARVNQQMGRRRSVNEIASSLNMSGRTLQRKFKAEYNETLSSYLQRRRLELAKKALLVQGLSIGEVAYHAGYNHSSNFVHAFKRAFGLTPTEYASMHR